MPALFVRQLFSGTRAFALATYLQPGQLDLSTYFLSLLSQETLFIFVYNGNRHRATVSISAGEFLPLFLFLPPLPPPPSPLSFPPRCSFASGCPMPILFTLFWALPDSTRDEIANETGETRGRTNSEDIACCLSNRDPKRGTDKREHSRLPLPKKPLRPFDIHRTSTKFRTNVSKQCIYTYYYLIMFDCYCYGIIIVSVKYFTMWPKSSCVFF